MSQLLDGLRAFADNREALGKVPLCAAARIDLPQFGIVSKLKTELLAFIHARQRTRWVVSQFEFRLNARSHLEVSR